jgi:hypothetical protein
MPEPVRPRPSQLNSTHRGLADAVLGADDFLEE